MMNKALEYFGILIGLIVLIILIDIENKNKVLYEASQTLVFAIVLIIYFFREKKIQTSNIFIKIIYYVFLYGAIGATLERLLDSDVSTTLSLLIVFLFYIFFDKSMLLTGYLSKFNSFSFYQPNVPKSSLLIGILMGFLITFLIELVSTNSTITINVDNFGDHYIEIIPGKEKEQSIKMKESQRKALNEAEKKKQDQINLAKQQKKQKEINYYNDKIMNHTNCNSSLGGYIGIETKYISQINYYTNYFTREWRSQSHHHYNYNYPGGGLEITYVAPHSPAEKGGLVVGDVIIVLNYDSLFSTNEYTNYGLIPIPRTAYVKKRHIDKILKKWTCQNYSFTVFRFDMIDKDTGKICNAIRSGTRQRQTSPLDCYIDINVTVGDIEMRPQFTNREMEIQ